MCFFFCGFVADKDLFRFIINGHVKRFGLRSWFDNGMKRLFLKF